MPDEQILPTLLKDFDLHFPDEQACIDLLFALRWPQGFICPYCRTRYPRLAPQRFLSCSFCGNRSSLTTGTVMHGAKKPIRQWLLAIWWFSGSGLDTSAKDLQRLLDVSCYQTAWSWLQKLRAAMGDVEHNSCRGLVEIGCVEVVPARERRERALVMIAAEIVLALGVTGRIRMRHIAACDEKTLHRFLLDTVQDTSSLVSVDPTLALLLGKVSQRFCPGMHCSTPARTKELAALFESCLHGVHRGGVTVKHLQLYLNEFCFRHNAGLLPDHQAVFRSLLNAIFRETLPPYRDASVLQAELRPDRRIS